MEAGMTSKHEQFPEQYHPSMDVPDEPELPAAEARPCPVPVKPGYGQAAFKAGCEDEWIDRMQSRYGGEW